MAFDIGERVSNKFFGTGTVISEMFKDEEGEVFQQVKWDKSGIESHASVKRLTPTEDGGDIGA